MFKKIDLEKIEIPEDKFKIDIAKDWTAEKLVKIFDDVFSKYPFNPIEKFEFNILKSKILFETSQEIARVLDIILEKLTPNIYNIDFVSESFTQIITKIILTGGANGLMTYLAYTEQSLVSAITASEIYFRDKIEYETQKNSKSLLSFGERKIEVKRIIEIELDPKSISRLVFENDNFQDLDIVRKLFRNCYGSNFDPFKHLDLNELKKIFLIRHIIVHKGGIIDHQFIKEFGTNKLLDFEINLSVGNRLILERNQISSLINFIETSILNLEHIIENKKIKFKMDESTLDFADVFKRFDQLNNENKNFKDD